MRLSREKQLQQAGAEVGLTVDPNTPYPQAHQPGQDAANALGLKRTSDRMAFMGGYGLGRAERIIDDIRAKHQGGA
jgi:hypothetical protein